MRVIFSRRNSIGTPFIRFVTWSAWSHCALIDEDTQTVIQAIAFEGVVEEPLAGAIKIATKYEIVDISVPDPAAALAWARSQLGKAYDYLGVLGIGLHREWNAEDKWWCSEFVEAALSAGGRRRFRMPQRITPQDSYNVL
jgi:uncharacterized protein YycO